VCPLELASGGRGRSPSCPPRKALLPHQSVSLERPARRSGPPASPGRVASERDPAKEARFTSRSHLRFLDVEAAVIDHRLIEHFDIFSDHLLILPIVIQARLRSILPHR
jgi:hypothetical protein